jgi:membrane-associated phospholipid phosphatase
MKRWLTLPTAAGLLLAALVTASPGGAADVVEGAKVGTRRTWVLASGSEIPVPAPPADNSDQTKMELEELRQLQKERSSITNTAIQYYNAVPATQRWHDQALALALLEKQSSNRQIRLMGILHTALYDAVVATWAAKYTHNRKSPTQLASDLTLVETLGGPPATAEPSYPSEHAAIAGTAVGILTAFFPKEEANLKATAAELGQTRLQMGANYRSDLDAGMALGQAVAQKALARAATDGSDAVWTGTVPTGAGLWTGTNPLEPLQGTWKPWLMTRGDQFRPGPPPAVGSAEMNEELALIKSISNNPTPSQRAIAVAVATNPVVGFWATVYPVIQRERLSVPREVRMTSLVAAVQFDAGVASHDTKYTYWRPRPNMADPTIVPVIGVPNHPAYPSNAAIIASALAEVMGYFSPPDAAQFRYFAGQAGLSRIYGGIHFPSDERAGSEMGKKIAALAIQRDQLNGP